MPNAERVTFGVTMETTSVVDPSPIGMQLDGYDLSTGIVLRSVERSEGSDTYEWYSFSPTT